MSNALAPRFALADLKVARGAAIAGQKGWIPLPTLCPSMRPVAFIDELTPAPVMKSTRQRVSILYLATVELMVAAKVSVEQTNLLNLPAALGPRHQNRWHLPWPTEDSCRYVPLLDLLNGKAGPDALKEKSLFSPMTESRMQRSIRHRKGEAHRCFTTSFARSMTG